MDDLALRRYALRSLARKAQYSQELKMRLMTRGAFQDQAEEILCEFQDLGFLNDREWVEGFVRSNLARKVGPRRILDKLREKKVPEELTLYARDLMDEEDQAEQVKNLLLTRYSEYRLDNPKERKKVIASLLRRGYDYAVIAEELRLD